MKRVFNFFSAIVFIAACLIPGSCVEEVEGIRQSQVTAAFTADATQVSTGQTVTFTDESTGDVTHWSWTFEGGTPERSHVQHPTVVYDEPGTYEVKLVVSNPGYTSEAVKADYIVVAAAPEPITADFTADKVSILSGESVTFTSTAEGNPDTWAWEFVSGSGTAIHASEENPTVTFDEPGIYSAKLTASNSVYSDEELKENYITVVDALSVAAEFSADTRVTYAGRQVSFTDLSVGAVTGWQWTFEGGSPASSTEQNPVITYASPGRYTVTLEVTNGVNTSVNEKTEFITIIPSNDLVTFLPFNGSAEDKGPLDLAVNNTGTVAFTGIDRHNEPDATAIFDGAGTLLIPATPEKQLGTSSYSVGVWLKTDVPSRMMIWEEGGGGAGTPQAWFRMNDNSSTNIYRLNTNTGGFLNVGIDDGASPLSDGQWHYVVCVRDASGSSRIYVDGVMMKELNGVTINSLDNDVGFTIGGQYNGPDNIGNVFTGQLDDLVIYKRVLSADEIAFLSGV